MARVATINAAAAGVASGAAHAANRQEANAATQQMGPARERVRPFAPATRIARFVLFLHFSPLHVGFEDAAIHFSSRLCITVLALIGWNA